MKIDGRIFYYNKENDDEYAQYISLFPNWLQKEDRYFGYKKYYYDGNQHTFGFWWFNIGWGDA